MAEEQAISNFDDRPLHERFPHYHKNVSKYKSVDVYRVLKLWDVKDPAVAHAIKKLLCAGGRGSKGFEQDLREASASINRALQMLAEEDTNG